jgi:hypothetical protein
MQLGRSLASWAVVAGFALGALGGCASEGSGEEAIEVATTTNSDTPIARSAEDTDVATPATKSDVPALAKSPKLWDEVQLGERVTTRAETR